MSDKIQESRLTQHSCRHIAPLTNKETRFNQIFRSKTTVSRSRWSTTQIKESLLHSTAVEAQASPQAITTQASTK